MRLKILFFPFSLSIALAVALLYVKPGIDTAMATRDQLNQKQATLDDLNQKVQNISNLAGDLDAHGEYESLALRYAPNEQKHDRMIDMLNFLATQSGVALTSIDLQKVAEDKKDPSAVPEPPTPSASMAAAMSSPMPTQPQTPKVIPLKMVDARLSLTGGYENIKDFLNKLLHSDSFQEFRSVSLSAADKDSSAPDSSSDLLSASITTRFSYLPVSGNAATSSPELFTQSKLDFSSLEKLKGFISSPVADLEVGNTGKTNPFVGR